MGFRRSVPQSFRDRNFFPVFEDCPGEHELDDSYLVDVDPAVDVDLPAGGMKNRKHWCLLGEIIQADTFIRPRIVARDVNGGEFVVAFYPYNPNDMPRLLGDFKVGNTIAIFYALGHYFLDGTAGVRVEDSDEVLIIPLKLNDVFAMNSEVIKHTVANGIPPKCHTCGEAKENMNKCSRCKLFYYCDKDCQVKAWKEKDHKKYCKILKNENINLMHFLDYGTHRGNIALN